MAGRERVDCCFELEITPIPSHLSWADRSQAVISWIILDFPFQTYGIKNAFTQLCAPFVSTFFSSLSLSFLVILGPWRAICRQEFLSKGRKRSWEKVFIITAGKIQAFASQASRGVERILFSLLLSLCSPDSSLWYFTSMSDKMSTILYLIPCKFRAWLSWENHKMEEALFGLVRSLCHYDLNRELPDSNGKHLSAHLSFSFFLLIYLHLFESNRGSYAITSGSVSEPVCCV